MAYMALRFETTVATLLAPQGALKNNSGAPERFKNKKRNYLGYNWQKRQKVLTVEDATT